jgi:hypothetical protein
MKATTILILCVFLALACETKPPSQEGEIAKTNAVSSAVQPDTVYSNEWNMGRDYDDPFSSIDTRFVVRVAQFGSGILRVWLDTSRTGVSDKNRPFFPADSIQVGGLTKIDRFTQGCTYGAGPWKPRIGVVSDTLHEHRTRPKFIWFLDTVSVRIRLLPTDSASCFVAGPD